MRSAGQGQGQGQERWPPKTPIPEIGSEKKACYTDRVNYLYELSSFPLLANVFNCGLWTLVPVWDCTRLSYFHYSFCSFFVFFFMDM